MIELHAGSGAIECDLCGDSSSGPWVVRRSDGSVICERCEDQLRQWIEQGVLLANDAEDSGEKGSPKP